VAGPSILVNGEPGETVSVLDRGFQYGDGIFETIRVADGRPDFWERHMARLASGCERLRLPAPDGDLLRCEAGQLCEASRAGVLKIVVTRGIGGRGYRLPEKADPTRVVALFAAPGYPESFVREGVRARFCRARLSDQPMLAGLKHLNRLDQVMARGEWSDETIQEGLMCDAANNMIEGTMTNVFIVRGGALHTPDLSRCGVLGIMRGIVLDLAQQLGIETEIRAIPRDEMKSAAEIFLTNSVIGIWPVRELEGRDYRLGDVTRKLIEVLARLATD